MADAPSTPEEQTSASFLGQPGGGRAGPHQPPGRGRSGRSGAVLAALSSATAARRVAAGAPGNTGGRAARPGRLNPSWYADPAMSSEPAGVPAPPSPEEPLAQRVLRQARTGQLDEDRLLPGQDKRERDLMKKLDKLAAQSGWHTFVSAQAHAIATGKAPARRNAEIMVVQEATRWRREVERFALERLDEFDAGIQHALEHPAPLQRPEGQVATFRRRCDSPRPPTRAPALQRLGRGSRAAPPMTGSGLKRRHDETDPPPPGRQAPPRVWTVVDIRLPTAPRRNPFSTVSRACQTAR